MITCQGATKNILLATGMAVFGQLLYAVGSPLLNHTLWAETGFSPGAATTYGMGVMFGFIIGRWWSW